MSVIKSPIVTEKSTNDSELNNRYWFYVNIKSNKITIKKSIEEKYGVRVLSVKTQVAPVKSKVKYTKNGLVTETTKRQKKAIVQLAEGDVIDFFSN